MRQEEDPIARMPEWLLVIIAIIIEGTSLTAISWYGYQLAQCFR